MPTYKITVQRLQPTKVDIAGGEKVIYYVDLKTPGDALESAIKDGTEILGQAPDIITVEEIPAAV